MTQSSTEEHLTLTDNDLWSQFSQSQEIIDFYNTWLGMISLRINRTVRAVLVLGEPDSGLYNPVAFWPEGQGGASALAELAESTLQQKQGMAGQLDDSGNRFGISYPVIIDQQLYGVVAIETSGQSMSVLLEQALKQLRWGCGWLEARLRKEQTIQYVRLNDRLVTAIELVVSVLELPDYQSSIKALVTELAHKLNCERVSLGFKHREYIRVEAISHTVELEKKMNIFRAIAKAMDESFDQRQPLCYPAQESSLYIVREHQALARQFGSRIILSFPLYVHSQPNGVLLFERQHNEPFTDIEVEMCRSVAALVAPILHEKQLNDRSLFRKIVSATGNSLSKVLGPDYYFAKAMTLFIAIFLISLFLLDGQYRVTADTVLEGRVQRSIVTPFDAFIIETQVRAGDVVEQGQLLAQLDDKDLLLERLSLLSQQGQLIKQRDESMAVRDRAKVNIIAAQISQVSAELKLVDEKIARTQIVAPFAGLIIRGDLYQMLGSSVAQGDLLFMIAPLNDYRIILQVNERDIQQIQEGLQGILILSSLPDEKLTLLIERITPVSTAEEGENYFRVEAALQQNVAQLRPGMEGVAKIEIGERSLAWIWSHEITDWIKLWLWRWLP